MVGLPLASVSWKPDLLVMMPDVVISPLDRMVIYLHLSIISLLVLVVLLLSGYAA